MCINKELRTIELLRSDLDLHLCPPTIKRHTCLKYTLKLFKFNFKKSNLFELIID